MSERLSRNLGLLYGAEILGKLLGVVVFGFLFRTLMEVRYGDLEFALGLLFILNLVIDAGLGHYGAREAAKDPDETEALVGRIFVVRTVLVLVSFATLAAVAFAMPIDGLARTVILLHGVVLLSAPLVLSWVFQARDRMAVVSAANLTRQVVHAAGVFSTVRGPQDVWMVPLWDAVGLGLGAGLQVWLYGREGGRIRPLAHLSGIGTVIRESAPLAASSVVWALRLFAPLLSLGIWVGSEAVGLFGASHRLVVAGHSFVWLYFFNILPTLSRLGMDRDLSRFNGFFTASMRIIGWTAICGAAVAWALSETIITVIYGPDGSVEAFSVMIWMLAFSFVSGHHRFALIALSLQRLELWANVAGAALSVGACLVLGDRLTILNAALIFVVAEGLTWIAATVLLKRAVPSVSVLRGVGVPLVVTATAVLGVRALAVPEGPVTATVLLGVLATVAVALERRTLRGFLSQWRAGR